MFVIGLIGILASNAYAGEEACAQMCADLDAAAEMCEAHFGDGDALCESIGDVDDAHCADDSTLGECEGLCADIEGLDDACDDSLDEDHPVCGALDAIADGQCEDEDDDDEDDDDDDEPEGDDEEGDDEAADAMGLAMGGAGCRVVPAGGLAALPLLLLAVRRRRA